MLARHLCQRLCHLHLEHDIFLQPFVVFHCLTNETTTVSATSNCCNPHTAEKLLSPRYILLKYDLDALSQLQRVPTYWFSHHQIPQMSFYLGEIPTHPHLIGVPGLFQSLMHHV